MVVKTGMSMSEYSYERIMKAKPPRMNKSEWFETLMLKQLDAQNDVKRTEHPLPNLIKGDSRHEGMWEESSAVKCVTLGNERILRLPDGIGGVVEIIVTMEDYTD